MSVRAEVVVGLTVLLLAGCATGPRGTGARVPNWESANIASAPAPVPAPAPPRPPAQSNGITQSNRTAETWIPLASWCKANGLGAPSRLAAAPLPTYGVLTPNGGLVLRVGTRLAYMDGTQVWLGFGPQLIGEQPCVHALDLKKTLEPLISRAAAGFGTHPPVVVLDPGHGGEDAGTRSVVGNLCEKDVTLDWARRLQQLLVAQGWRVLLTRTGDTGLALSNRLAFAEEHRADLFLSLHFNSSAPDHEQAGVETYCLTPVGEASSVTRGFSDDPALAFPNNAFDARNLQVAFQVQRALLRVGGSQDRGVRRARYLGVVRGQNRAAILVEGGYLSNPREARLIANPAHRQQMAEALAKALGDWAEVRAPDSGIRHAAIGGSSRPAQLLSQTNSPP